MPVASVTEISATSSESFEDATLKGIARATQTLRGVEGAWVKDMNVLIEDGSIVAYKVNLMITFVLEDAEGEATSADVSDDVVLRTADQDTALTSGQEPPQ